MTGIDVSVNGTDAPPSNNRVPENATRTGDEGKVI